MNRRRNRKAEAAAATPAVQAENIEALKTMADALLPPLPPGIPPTTVECSHCGEKITTPAIWPKGAGAIEHHCKDSGDVISIPSPELAAMLAAQYFPGEKCQRETRHDSIRWVCGCGAGGPVGRSNDGIPFVTEEMLEHSPGQQKGAA